MARRYRVTYTNGKDPQITVETTANTRRSAERVGRWKLQDVLIERERATGRPRGATGRAATALPKWYPISCTFAGRQ